MKLPGGAHLTYCSNIHPGETWDEVRANLERHLPAIKRHASPGQPMGVGLRLSAFALSGLEQAGALPALRRWLDEQSLYVFTLNGFPYGAFHGKPVKDAVYRPDWREPERLDYTNRLADTLAALLPEGVAGSISTVPGAYRAHLDGKHDLALIAQRLLEHAAYLHRLHERTGKLIALALEPEPDCLLETGRDAAGFFSQYLFGETAVQQARAVTGLGRENAPALLRRHLGLCLDTCHGAVAFEDPADCLGALRDAGVPIHKVQLSAGLAVSPVEATQRAALAGFAEDVYLHQTVAKVPTPSSLLSGQAGLPPAERSRSQPFASTPLSARLNSTALAQAPHGRQHYPDLPHALADPAPAEEWRIHYHVPIWAEALPPFATTRPWLEALLALNRDNPITNHWEVETYTWSVLPPEHRNMDIDEAIAKELLWARERLA